MQARSRYFKDLLEAAVSYGATYHPPSEDLLRTRLLVDAVGQLDQELGCLDATIELYGSTIVSDGWSYARMRPILNMLQISADGVKFLDAIDTTGKTKVYTSCKPTLNSQDLYPESLHLVIYRMLLT